MNRNGMNLVQMAQELMRRAEAKRDFVADTRELDFHVDGSSAYLFVDHQAFQVMEHTHGQLANRLEIPKRYYDRMRQKGPRLLERNVKYWFREKPERRMVRTLDGNARAFLSDRYHRIDNEQIADMVLPTLLESEADGIEIVSCAVTDWKLYVQARFPRLEGEVKRGDPVQGGITISNGEVGNGALTIEPMIYRLVCTNGLVVGSAVEQGRLKRHHTGRRLNAGESYEIYTDETRAADDRALMLKVRDSIRALAQPELFQRVLEDMRQATEGPRVANPIAAVETLGKAYSLSQGERESVLTRLIEDRDYSRWGMVNAVTATANDHKSYDRAVELEYLGGRMLNMPAKQWQPIAEAERLSAAA